MRITVDLPEDLYAQAAAISSETDRTLSETVARLMRRGLPQGHAAEAKISPRTGLPVVHLSRTITTEDVRMLEG